MKEISRMMALVEIKGTTAIPTTPVSGSTNQIKVMRGDRPNFLYPGRAGVDLHRHQGFAMTRRSRNRGKPQLAEPSR